MPKPQLFLLKARFADPSLGKQGQWYHCPHCARIEGLLSYFPKLRKALDVHYVDFEKPRAVLVAMLGEAHQSCPVLITEEAAALPYMALGFRQHQTHYFLDRPETIAAYLAEVYQISQEHP